MVAVRQELYDPMVYDIMRERATRLRGRYVALERGSLSTVEANGWRQARQDLIRQVDEVDALSEDAVRAASAEFARRFFELEQPRAAAG